MIFNVTRKQNLSELVAFLLLIFSHGAIAKETDSKRIESEIKFIESESKLQGWMYEPKGWTHEGVCENNDDSPINYRLDYYVPNTSHYEGYGILKIIVDNKKMTFSGFELYPEFSDMKNRDCKITVVGKNILILETQDWGPVKDYFVSINLLNKTKTVFQYNYQLVELRYAKKISNDVFLIAGFGVCQQLYPKKIYFENFGSNFKQFCKKDVSQNRVDLATEDLKSAIKLSINPNPYNSSVVGPYPYIPGVGLGVFNYYVICEDCISDSEEINRSLKEFLTVIPKDFKSIKAYSESEFYNSLLAWSSIFINAPQLEKDFPITPFLKVEDKNKGLESAFKAYWNIIFKKN